MQPYDTTSLDIPPALAALLGMQTQTQAPVQPPFAGIGGAQAPQPMPGLAMPGAGPAPTSIPSPAAAAIPGYAVGGQIGVGGMPTNPQPGQMPMAPSAGPGLAAPGANQKPMDAQQVEAEAQKFVQSHPQQVQQIQAAIQQAMQSGELTQQQLNMMVQLATVALQNPEMYPQLRKMAIQQGLATEQELSQQYDQGLLFVLVVVGKTMQAGGQQQGPMPSMKDGGPVPKVPEDQPVVIKAHEGEYVIPKHVVQAKGTEFFDKLLENYKQGS